ncbi:hypothetical protein Pan153_37380 [Gimesia panareensis]|uniref:Signal peptide-containing protein n=1 Tax=Gimesia panareensis TaxID=2527978 RepID=A0A518FRZ0_9PLAN|nr:hypothetical protein [Gimesia panareensis]QDV19075.1 hypothetical protein Pan153_37380 [Gimesia panareensis]
MNWIVPRVRNVRKILPYLLYGTVLGGLYGMMHDQISYTISREYFTDFKFHQFRYADFHLPERLFVGIIGFLATWWVGFFAGWFLGRIRFFSDDFTTAHRDMLQGFTIIFCCAVGAGILGGVVGYLNFYVFDAQEFMGFEKQFSGTTLKRFAIVGTIHNSGYAGGLAGFIVAIFLLKRKMKKSLSDV